MMTDFADFKNHFSFYNKWMTNVHPEVSSIFEATNYPEYNWFCGTFMTDKFGGIAVIIKYYDNKWFVNEKEVTEEYITSNEFNKYIYDEIAALTKIRINDELDEFINSQY